MTNKFKYVICYDELNMCTSYIKIRDYEFDICYSILKKINTKINIQAVAENLVWEDKNCSKPFDQIIHPKYFIQLYGSIPAYRDKVKLGKRTVGIDPALRQITDDELKFLLNIWNNKHQSAKMKSYLKYLNKPELKDLIIVSDILL